VPVTLGYLAGHVDVVVEHIRRGALRLQSHADAFVDPTELRALLKGAGLLVGGPGEEEGGGGEETTQPEIPEQESDEAQPDASPEPEPQPEQEQQEDTQSEPEPESTQEEASPEPMDEGQPELAENESSVGSADMASAMPPLPDGWKTRNKRALLDLCKERNVVASNTLSNRDIIALLEGVS
jgi:outer membrane biosynthesis protein TonB